MVYKFNTKNDSFEVDFTNFINLKREQSKDVSDVVKEIISLVRSKGDRALVELTHKFDRADLDALGLTVADTEIDHALDHGAPETLDALRYAQKRIEAHHLRQVPVNDRYRDSAGVELGTQWSAIESVGLYVPGGTATYPSSVLMNAIPAKVAGVKRIVMVHPATRGKINPLVLAAAKLAGVDEIYRIGGAQAIAALAYGTESVRAVNKIVGPGNAFVAEAKRQVFGIVGIDMIAGPSEVVIVADDTVEPSWVAADLLAQAEHDTAAQAIVITDNQALADAIELCVRQQVLELPRHETALESWQKLGAVIVLEDINQAPEIVDLIAPEHLELMIRDADEMVSRISNAGAVFIGKYTPEVIGDYVGGSNHVLPTARTARFSSGLGVLDFMKRSSILKLTENCLRQLGPPAMVLAEAEGLSGHARSVSVRLNDQAKHD